METRIPCTVAYHFTLLDVNQDLRYCCRGNKVADKYHSLSSQWEGEKYREFRQYWKNTFLNTPHLCEGCPHIEENRYYANLLNELNLLDLVNNSIV